MLAVVGVGAACYGAYRWWFSSPTPAPTMPAGLPAEPSSVVEKAVGIPAKPCENCESAQAKLAEQHAHLATQERIVTFVAAAAGVGFVCATIYYGYRCFDDWRKAAKLTKEYDEAAADLVTGNRTLKAAEQRRNAILNSITPETLRLHVPGFRFESPEAVTQTRHFLCDAIGVTVNDFDNVHNAGANA